MRFYWLLLIIPFLVLSVMDVKKHVGRSKKPAGTRKLVLTH